MPALPIPRYLENALFFAAFFFLFRISPAR
jgi:hypothetical protein